MYNILYLDDISYFGVAFFYALVIFSTFAIISTVNLTRPDSLLIEVHHIMRVCSVLLYFGLVGNTNIVSVRSEESDQ